MPTPTPTAKPEAKGESSNSAAKANISNANGTATYELPWYAVSNQHKFSRALLIKDLPYV